MEQNKTVQSERYFINFTNHPSSKWEVKQKAAAEAYGHILDIPFPAVNPASDEDAVHELAETYAGVILSNHPSAVLCQGEFTLCLEIIQMLEEKNIPVFAACSERKTIEKGKVKQSVFEFVRFRRYARIKGGE